MRSRFGFMFKFYDSEFSILSFVEETHSHLSYFKKGECISIPVPRKEVNWLQSILSFSPPPHSFSSGMKGWLICLVIHAEGIEPAQIF